MTKWALLLLVMFPGLARAQTCEARCLELESQIQEAMTESGLQNVMARMERVDGRVLEVVTGVPNVRYISSSTAKPVMMSVILDSVVGGALSLDARAVDILPGFSANATNAQRRISLRHLVTFTSGMIHGPEGPGSIACSQRSRSQVAFSACIDLMPLGNNSTVEPGVTMQYSSWQLALAGQMAVVASGAEDWEALFTAWRERVGLFQKTTWNRGFWFAADQQLNITAEEFADYLRALYHCSILTPRLCALQQADHMPWAQTVSPTRTTWGIGEDWHFGAGTWAECRSPSHDCLSHTRISTIGVAGQYAYLDRKHGYWLVVSATFAGLRSGLVFARSIDHLVKAWGGER